MPRIWILIFVVFFAACGVKRDPIPYVDAYPDDSKKTDQKKLETKETK